MRYCTTVFATLTPAEPEPEPTRRHAGTTGGGPLLDASQLFPKPVPSRGGG